MFEKAMQGNVMRSRFRLQSLVFFGLLALGFFLAPSSPRAAQRYSHSYSKWSYHAQKKYHYRNYYYKSGSHHYGIYYPSKGRKMYMYNPAKKRWWGYYDFDAKGYSLLKAEDRKEDIEQIPESAFPKPSREMPEIPGEAVKFEPPTDALPDAGQ